MDLVEQSLEALVFGEPPADLREQFLGDVAGAGLAPLLASQVLARVPRSAVVAAAGKAAAAVGAGTEGGGQDRRGRGQLLEVVWRHAEDEGRVVRNAHGAAANGAGGIQRA
jgi:hypothetical protein